MQILPSGPFYQTYMARIYAYVVSMQKRPIPLLAPFDIQNEYNNSTMIGDPNITERPSKLILKQNRKS
jgi:hypothetical protein